MSGTNFSLDQSLAQYRVLNTPTKFSWKQYWAQETFSSDDLLQCPEDERHQFTKRLEECAITIAENVRGGAGHPTTLTELVSLLTDPANKNLTKTNRKIIYSTANGERPVGKKAFSLWNGFQVIDLDIKNEQLSQKLKHHIFSKLHKCNWFLGVTLSASHQGLHVYTKITVPQQSDPEDPEIFRKQKMLYLTNFRHKYSFVYISLLSGMEQYGYTKEDILRWMDLAMFKPQQGAFIGYDEHPLINTGFFEDFIYVNFDNIEDLGHPDIDWVSYPDLKELFKRWEWFEEDTGENLDIKVLEAGDLDGTVVNKVHYKHFERWRLANTLVKLYGTEKGYKYLRFICSNDTTDKELQADCITASRHNKPIDVWAVNRLNQQHGFKIKLNVEDMSFDESEIFSSMERIENPVLIQESKYLKNFHLSTTQYLSDIVDDLLDSCGRITLIEAGAGVGKTEMVKQIVRDMNKRVIMVMPFTSTIKSKVENDEDWYYAYGNRKVRLDSEQHGLSMTIDKFSHLNLMDIKTSGFDYIFIDESHLMFQSEYRPVMSKVIEMIRNTEVPIILMSGTPSGEIVFFPDIVHLKVVKDDVRRKEFKVNLVDTPSDLMYHMCRQMAADISTGKRILYPTNAGTLHARQIEAAVNFFLQHDHAEFEPVRLHYYKKSNIGETFMDDVNFEKTVKDTQILMCTNYLSVGVDILDKYNFNIYFGDLFLPQELEQFANRLRSNDLYIHMYIAKNDAEGNSRSIHRFRPMNFKLNDEEIKNVHSILRICNEMIERNPVEYRYNSLVASILHDNKFIEYNEIDNKYYLNEIAYKVINFERKYREYAQQLPVVMKGMQVYGYDISSRDLKDFRMLDEGIQFTDLKSLVKLAYDNQLDLNTQHISELLDIITEDRLNIYKEVLQGRYDIKKGDTWKEDLTNHRMVVKNIEVFEKVVPICISLSKQYEMPQIVQIFEHCRKKGGSYNFAAINRFRVLINILYNDKHGRLDLPINEYMNNVYNFLLEHTTQDNTCIATKAEITNFIRNFTRTYAHRVSREVIQVEMATLTMEMLYKKFEEIFKCLVNASRPNRQNQCKMEKVELLWQERDTYISSNGNSHIFAIDEFLGAIKIDSKKIDTENNFEEEEEEEYGTV